MITIKQVCVALAAGAIFGAGWTISDWRWGAKDAERSRVEQTKYALLVQERDALNQRLALSNDAHNKELQDARKQINDLRDRERAGAVRLRVAANCPAVPEAPPAPGVDNATGPELTDDARQAYFALRDGIAAVSAQLGACQDQLGLILPLETALPPSQLNSGPAKTN